MQDSFLTVFDLDDTLFSTSPVIRASYRYAGVHMHPSLDGLPWQEWLPQLTDDHDEVYRIRRAKADRYRLFILEGYVPQTTAFPVFAEIEDSIVLTGAGKEASDLLLENFSGRVRLNNATPQLKASYLFLEKKRGVYIDDNEVLGRKVVDLVNKMHTKDMFTFIHYTGQSSDELRKQIAECQKQ